jgi:hypothetical protein
VPWKTTEAPGATATFEDESEAQEWTIGRFAAGATCPAILREILTSEISFFWQASQIAWPSVPTGRFREAEEVLVIWTLYARPPVLLLRPRDRSETRQGSAVLWPPRSVAIVVWMLPFETTGR